MANEDKLNYTNTLQWHIAGYKGQGVKIALQDLSNTKYNPAWFPNARVIKTGLSTNPVSTSASINENHLAYQIASVLIFAPEAEIHIVGGSPDAFLQYLINNDIDIYTHSVTSSWYNTVNNAQESQIVNNGNVLFTAAGNTDDGGFIQLGNKSTWISVGAAHLYAGQPIRDSYSCFDSIGGVEAMFFTNYMTGTSSTGNGTSFASPSLAGAYAVWRGAFKSIYKRKPTFDETLKLIRTNCQSMIDPQPYSTGYGFFRLPNISTLQQPINTSITLEMWIDNIKAFKNGKEVTLGVAPVLSNNHTLVGVRDISELFGAKVFWTQAEKKITITTNSSNIVMFLDKLTCAKNNNDFTLEVAPTLVGDYTMIGLRDIATLLGCATAWKQSEQKITITSK